VQHLARLAIGGAENLAADADVMPPGLPHRDASG
jgi:hypothetical protein